MACLEGLPVTRKAGQPGRGRGCGQGARTGVRSLRVPWGDPRSRQRASPRAHGIPAAPRPCAYTRPGNHTAGNPMRPARQADPFTVLGLPAGPGLTDDEVRAAWRRVAAATHPDRADGGDAARFAAAAAAYTAIRTGFGRTEALADLARPAGVRRWKVQAPGLRRHRRARAAPLATGRRWGETATAAGRRPRGRAMVVPGAQGPPGQARAADRRRGGRQHRGGAGRRPTAGHARPHHRGTDLAGRDRPPRPGPAGMTAP